MAIDLLCHQASLHGSFMHTHNPLSRLQQALMKTQPLSLIESMACIAEEEDSSTSYSTMLTAFDTLANGLHLPRSANLFEKVARLNHYFFVQHCFYGSADDYYHPKNSLLHHALSDKKGLPITLSAIYMEVAQRADFQMLGIGAPGHFIVRPQAATDPMFFVDPFHKGEIISHPQIQARLRKNLGKKAHLEKLLAPVSTRQILLRMSMNLFNSYQRQQDPQGMLRNISRAGLLFPDNAQLQMQQASLLLHLQQPDQAISLIESWLQQHPYTPDSQKINRWLQELKLQL